MIENTINLRFHRRPAPILAEHRPLYKIVQILLVLQLASRGGKSSLPRLHLFNWALKRHERCNLLVDAAKSKKLYVTAWGFDPAVAIAIRYGVAEQLMRLVSNGYQITDQGELFVNAVMKDAELYCSEKGILALIGKGVTEGMVDAVAKDWEKV